MNRISESWPSNIRKKLENLILKDWNIEKLKFEILIFKNRILQDFKFKNWVLRDLKFENKEFWKVGSQKT